jgi:hypothetical protein
VLCDPGLPNRAVVTTVQFTLRDSASGDIKFCGLLRSGLAPQSATSYQVLASVPATPLGDPDPGTVRKTDTSIDFATIDNARFGYWLQCRLGGDGGDLGIYGASVTYQISAANG